MTTQATSVLPASDGLACDRYLRLPDVLALAGVSWRTLLRWEREGRFPKRYKIGARIVAWKESEIKLWFSEGAIASTTTIGTV